MRAVRDAAAARREERDVGVVRPDAVREQRRRPERAERIELRDRRTTGARARPLDAGAALGAVQVDAGAEAARERCALGDRLVEARLEVMPSIADGSSRLQNTLGTMNMSLSAWKRVAIAQRTSSSS